MANNHKVVNINITYEPNNMDNSQAEFEKKIETFLQSIKGTKGVKVKAKRHDVAVDILLDEYGMEIS